MNREGDPMPRDGSIFTETLTSARRPTDYYRWRMLIMQSATPDEVQAIHGSRPRLPLPERQWLNELVERLTREFENIRGFSREEVDRSSALYRSTSRTPQGERTLLVAFASKGHRMLVETCVFLQHLPEGRYDVLMLRDERKHAFLDGLPGIAHDLPSLCAGIEQGLALGYARIQTMGASMGGFPALLAARLLQAERGVAVGGGVPDAAAARVDLTAPDEALDDRPLLLCVFAEGHDSDRRRAHELAETLGGTRLVEVQNAAEHTLLNTARHRGALGRLLAHLLDGEPDGSAMAVDSPPGQWASFSLPAQEGLPTNAVERRLNGRRVRVATGLLGAPLRALTRLPLPVAARELLLRATYWRLGIVTPEQAPRRQRRRPTG